MPKQKILLTNIVCWAKIGRRPATNRACDMAVWLVTLFGKHNFVVLSYFLCLSSSMKLCPGWQVRPNVSETVNVLADVVSKFNASAKFQLKTNPTTGCFVSNKFNTFF